MDVPQFEIEKESIKYNELVLDETEEVLYYKDPLTLKRIDTLHPVLRAEAHKIYDEICQAVSGSVVVRFSWTFRSFEEQDKIYQQGRTTPGSIVSNAKAGESFHNYGLAIDIVLLVDKDVNGTFETASWSTKADFDKDGQSDWSEVVEVFKKYGWEWGGDWRRRDDPHFQKTLGFNVMQLSGMRKSIDNKYPVL